MTPQRESKEMLAYRRERKNAYEEYLDIKYSDTKTLSDLDRMEQLQGKYGFK